jgi:hypothetical protein
MLEPFARRPLIVARLQRDRIRKAAVGDQGLWLIDLFA